MRHILRRNRRAKHLDLLEHFEGGPGLHDRSVEPRLCDGRLAMSNGEARSDERTSRIDWKRRIAWMREGARQGQAIANRHRLEQHSFNFTIVV
jgi:hypothetical protein